MKFTAFLHVNPKYFTLGESSVEVYDWEALYVRLISMFLNRQ